MGGPNRDELLRFSTFCPKAMAGLETLANKPALYSRCFHIPMRRRTDDEAGGNFIYDDVLPDGKRLAERASAWAKLNVDELRDKRPQSPAAWLTNRNWEVSRPLWIIAEQLGGDWKERLLDALEEEAKGSGETQTWGVRLLADCRSIFEKYSVEEPLMEIPKKRLLKDLLKIEDAPYSGWGWEDGGTSKMSRKLSGYGIEQDRKVGPEDHRERGYLRSDFEDAWKRYLPPVPSKEEEEDDFPSSRKLPSKLLEELMEAIAVGADMAEECRAYADEIERRAGYDSSLARALREVADLYDRASKLVPGE